MDPKIGQTINNKYRLIRLIGDGGMGSVFEAEHELLGTTVALKFLHTALSRRKGLVDRFLQEAQVSARIKSAHVVRVSDVDRTPDGLAYMVMEYVEGKTLQHLYEELYEAGKRLSYGDAFAIMMQMLDGVGAAHGRNIVHRDLKPDNVMITRDSKGRMLVKILDFGIAKLKASGEMDRGLTRPGVVMGTPEYMAPEQAFSADKVDARADIFSLGVMFFEMLAGRRPVGGDNAHAIAAQYLEGKISRLRELKPAIAEELASAVHRAMEAEPNARFDSVAAFRGAIESFSPAGPGAELTLPSAILAAVLDVDGDVSSVEDVEDQLSSDASGGQDSDARNSVPETVPPEQTYSRTPNVVGANVVGDSDGDGTDAAPNSSDLQTRVAAAVSAVDVSTGVDPLADTSNGEAQRARNAATEAMPMVDPAAMAASAALGAAARAGTEAMPPGAAPSGTQPGNGDAPHHSTAAMAMAPTSPAKAAAGPYVRPPAAPAPRKRGRSSGPSIFTILLVAATVAGAVVGGVYLAHRANEAEEAKDDPPVLQLPGKREAPKPKATATPDRRPVVVPPPASPDPKPQARPRPRPRPTPRPPGPAPRPTPTNPFPVPTGFPTMLPSALPFPTFPPFPGQQPPSPSPQPSPGPSPKPTPKPKIPKLKFPLPKR